MDNRNAALNGEPRDSDERVRPAAATRGRRGRMAVALTLLAASVAYAMPVAPGRQDRRDSRPAPGLYARVRTDQGTFTVRLLEDAAPKNVKKFVELAEGTTDPATGKPGSARPFYDGLTFHRAVPGFVIQGGDPHGDGTGGPGYWTPDEQLQARHFDRAGLVAMASHGPNRNGSQFFVTLAPAPSLDGKFTIFGVVVDGMDVVRRIAAGKTKMLPGDRLEVPVVIESVKIERITE